MTESFEHYASKYYDPVKAHEYYMKTRHLKGYDTQGKTLNDEGKQAKAYITKRIREERYSVLERKPISRRSISSLRRRLVLIIRRLWIVKSINSIPMLR